MGYGMLDILVHLILYYFKLIEQFASQTSILPGSVIVVDINMPSNSLANFFDSYMCFGGVESRTTFIS